MRLKHSGALASRIIRAILRQETDMHFNGPIVRPQTDADSLFIEVTVGCTHNSCTFCNFYDGYRFSVAPISQIREDLEEAKAVYPQVRKIWANGGNPYALATEKLGEIGRLIKEYYPESRISTYARVNDLTRKTVEEMRYLKECGWEDLVVGFETGDDISLKYVNKGYTAADILDGCTRLEQAGVDYRMIFLGGLAGKGKCELSARTTADLLNKLHPYIMYLNSVSILPGTGLYGDRAKGLFEEAGERELVLEFATLLENMNNDIYIFAAPNTTPFSFFMDLQPNKDRIVSEMRAYADKMSDRDEKLSSQQRSMRRSV